MKLYFVLYFNISPDGNRIGKASPYFKTEGEAIKFQKNNPNYKGYLNSSIEEDTFYLTPDEVKFFAD